MGFFVFGGEGGIRTLGTDKGTPAFQASSIGHSNTSPCAFQQGCEVYAFLELVTSLGLSVLRYFSRQYYLKITKKASISRGV